MNRTVFSLATVAAIVTPVASVVAQSNSQTIQRTGFYNGYRYDSMTFHFDTNETTFHLNNGSNVTIRHSQTGFQSMVRQFRRELEAPQ